MLTQKKRHETTEIWGSVVIIVWHGAAQNNLSVWHDAMWNSVATAGDEEQGEHEGAGYEGYNGGTRNARGGGVSQEWRRKRSADVWGACTSCGGSAMCLGLNLIVFNWTWLHSISQTAIGKIAVKTVETCFTHLILSHKLRQLHPIKLD